MQRTVLYKQPVVLHGKEILCNNFFYPDRRRPLVLVWCSGVFVWTKYSFVFDVYLISNSKHNTFCCTQIVLFGSNCAISGIPSLCNNSSTNYKTGVVLEPLIEQLDKHLDFDDLEDYVKLWNLEYGQEKNVKNVNIMAYFLRLFRKETYSLIKTLAFPEKPISLYYATLKELLTDHVKCTNF